MEQGSRSKKSSMKTPATELSESCSQKNMDEGEVLCTKMEKAGFSVVNYGVVFLYSYVGVSRNCPELMDIGKLQECCPGLLSVEKLPREWPLLATLRFCDWISAVNAVIGLWELRLQGVHHLTPELADDGTCSQMLTERAEKGLKQAFLTQLAKLKEVEAVKNCRMELGNLEKQLICLKMKLRKSNQVEKWERLTRTKEDVSSQIGLSTKQLSEYMAGLRSLEASVAFRCVGSNGDTEHLKGTLEEGTRLFKLEESWTWHQLHCIMERETFRFNARLPLYARRMEILHNIENNQVMVLIGETGSGKSTQLVQYLFDAGLARDGLSIACTQPRKIAAVALAQRVAEECRGCSKVDSHVGYLVSPSLKTQHFGKILYVTDYMLLQLCLSDPELSEFSCIVVDEAHERSLNTDLLLAMLKRCLLKRLDLKLVIMSATVDAILFSSYFGGCKIYQVTGRSFPVEFVYEPDEEEGLQGSQQSYSHPVNTRYVQRVVQKVTKINAEADKGDILAFLTSQAEVEWACSQSVGPSVIVHPLHGRLQYEEQQSVFKTAPEGLRKVVFATNIAETSLTIPGIKFVVDCGLVKESSVDSRNGMTVLRVCQIDKSAAMQRAGRAGRTQSGICYRLYSTQEFKAMAPHRRPEILRVHLALAVLKLFALGVQEIESFDFVESPDPGAVALAVKTLIQLGALVDRMGERHLTTLGWQLVKLGMDPRLGCIVLESISHDLGREGLVIAGLLSCSGSIFFRAGTEDEKARSDRLKMRFCHSHGDLFTLLSVYQEWDTIALKDRNKWCVDNSINAKSMRRCWDCVKEMEFCLKHELQVEVKTNWAWSSVASEECNEALRKVILYAMSTNLAVFTGHDRHGYDILSSGKQAYLHPSSAVLVFGNLPQWVVFGELLCTSREFLTSVTVVEPQWISELHPLPPYDVSSLLSSRMHKFVVPNLSRYFLNRLCGKYNRNLKHLVGLVKQGSDDRCELEADFEKQELQIFATHKLMQKAQNLVMEAVGREQRWINNECIEKCLFEAAPGRTSPVMVFGAGAEVRQLLMQGEYTSVEVFHSDASAVDEEDILVKFDRCADGIAGFHKELSTGNDRRKWGTVRFASPKGAEEAVTFLNRAKVGMGLLDVRPLITSKPSHTCKNQFLGVKATLMWPRRQCKDFAIIQCAEAAVDLVVRSCCGMVIGGSRVFCKRDRLDNGKVFMRGLETQVTEAELAHAVLGATGCPVWDVYIPRQPSGPQPTAAVHEASLVQELAHFVPSTKFQVTVRESEPKDYNTIAYVNFDECEHEGAARAIAHLQGHVLSSCQSWQRITCKQTFVSCVQCSRPVFSVLKEDLLDLVQALQQQNNGAEISLTEGESGVCRLKISAESLRMVAGCKYALEKLMEGMPFMHNQLDDSVIRLLFTREGFRILKSVELQTRTYIGCDERSNTAKIYGPTERKKRAVKKLVQNLLELQKRNQRDEISLRGEGKPSGLMREIVKIFGADLLGLRKEVPGASLKLNHRYHKLCVQGSKDHFMKVQKKIGEIAVRLKGPEDNLVLETLSQPESCAICFCDMEDRYNLEGCGHGFCRSCLLEQINSAIRHREGFPLTCAREGCPQLLLMADITALLTIEQQNELQKASLSAFVALSRGKYRFCTTPDCPAVYRVSEDGKLFACGACSVRLCTSCHVEYHLGLSCERYKEFKQDPDASLKAWRKGKQHVKNCPSCGSVIEKVDGCNHVSCKCQKHLCWLCLESFPNSEGCYTHLQNAHGGFYVA